MKVNDVLQLLQPYARDDPESIFLSTPFGSHSQIRHLEAVGQQTATNCLSHTTPYNPTWANQYLYRPT